MITINYRQFSKRDNQFLFEGSLRFDNYKEALDFILDFHNDLNDYSATYIIFGIIEETK